MTANLRDPFAPVEPPAVARRVTVVHHYQAPPPQPPALPASRYESEPEDDFFFGGYGGLVLRGSAVSRKAALLTGIRGGFIFGKRMAIGGAFYRLSHRFGPAIEARDGTELALEMAYGGLTSDITLLRRGRLELAVGGLVGAGVGCISREFDYDDESSCIDQVRMFVGEPEAAVRINVAPWMRLSATGGYRFVVREAWRPPNDFTMSGGYGGVNLEFGWFGNDRARL